MKKMLVLFMIPSVFWGLLVSCDFLVIKSGEEEYQAGDMAVYEARYNLRVVNNAEVAVTVYGPGIFYQDDTSMISLSNVANEKLCRVEASNETKIEFTWSPKGSLYYSDDPDHPDPSAEEIKAAYKPAMNSFFFKFVFDGGNEEGVYIVGWPETIELPDEATEEWDLIIPDDKIIQYNFGYAENKDVRIKDGFAYVPFIIEGTALPENDFDSAYTVFGNAKLTITSDSDICFETLNLSLSTEPEENF
jgi:hypothetical protein